METVNKSFEEMRDFLSFHAKDVSEYSTVKYSAFFKIFTVTLREENRTVVYYVGGASDSKWVLLKSGLSLADFLHWKICEEVLTAECFRKASDDKSVKLWDDFYMRSFKKSSGAFFVNALLKTRERGCHYYEEFLDLANLPANVDWHFLIEKISNIVTGCYAYLSCTNTQFNEKFDSNIKLQF